MGKRLITRKNNIRKEHIIDMITNICLGFI